MRLIDADEIRIKPEYMHDISGVVMVRVEDIARILNDMPPAKPEIVRCKECRWGRKVSGNVECFVDANVPPEYHDYEWFCPCGERNRYDNKI